MRSTIVLLVTALVIAESVNARFCSGPWHCIRNDGPACDCTYQRDDGILGICKCSDIKEVTDKPIVRMRRPLRIGF